MLVSVADGVVVCTTAVVVSTTAVVVVTATVLVLVTAAAGVEVAPPGGVRVTPTEAQSVMANWVALAKSAGEQAFWMAGVRPVMKPVFLHTQVMSVRAQPVEPRAAMAGPCCSGVLVGWFVGWREEDAGGVGLRMQNDLQRRMGER